MFPFFIQTSTLSSRWQDYGIMKNMNQNKTYFISDAHLGINSKEENINEEKLVKFCNFIKDSAKELYLVGEIFDFWFEYRTVVPSRHFKVLNAFHNLILSGTKIIYVGGNHDIWKGDFLTKEVGIEVHFKPITVDIDGKKVLIHHGDGFLKNTLNFNFAKKILRNKAFIFLYKLLHPDIGIPLGKATIKKIRERVYKKVDLDKARLEYKKAAIEFLQNSDIDVLIMGHTHKADFYNKDGKTYINLGNWITDFDYAVLEEERLYLRKFS